MKPAHKTLLLWLLLLLMFFALWRFLSPDAPNVRPVHDAPIGSGPWIVGAVLVVLSGGVVWFRRYQKGLTAALTRINAAGVHLAAGALDDADRELDLHAKEQPGHLVASAGLVRATVALRRGDREAALAHADAALGP